ncbi:glycosyltransferase family 2 protein [Autumnicola psychrophila]|uniref:Glycosyltransferase family 2 protein n=1 Tax=Autumnicola psychrophila TaxID=3075592 RepID=A0ABU3DQQ6_9FLAO|nr:glycosyltransferase family 2 protein [Zunongwangia sp. F225]MDT0686051.1 glycosyltransferase family 2 protein [Zunongwangia sp. F225]
MISTIILTKNEQKDLPACLDALGWCDDIHLLDSGSTDATLSIAEKYHVHIATNPFKSFGKQRNFALENLRIKHNWVLFLDADEICTEAFIQDVQNNIKQAPESVAGFYCCWKMMLENTWLKHCDNFPKWQFRILKKGRAAFTDFGHGQKEGDVDGEIRYIEEPYLHYGFSKGWYQWMERHNKYSTQEAHARFLSKPPLRDIFESNTSKRNPALKSWLSRMPGWPLLRFIHAYFFNLGFLEGKPGFMYCANMSYYEFLIQLKMRELKLSSPKE